MDHDQDDPPPVWSLKDWYWQYMNRAAEQGMWWARIIGLI